ncbi:alpha/beta hydrolase [Listeria aquatica]|uniref:Alpha/beta hydrolase n=1 Tax=Listeria aquatica TaxID=1494960 RepID=A0A841ZPE2_9LIST|nr:alpha/beta hydrolase [Listeria aquatica]MBC1522336.1 alpha/beta hydrolase [Listeria aquatica]
MNTIHYKEFGVGAPIYFIHGSGLDLESMIYFYEGLFDSKSCFSRVYLDIPGMGESIINQRVKNSDDILLEIKKFIDCHSKGRPIILCGHSYGGYICLGLVRILLSQISGFFLTCPVIRARKDDRSLAKHKNIVEERINPNYNQEFFSDYLNMNVRISEHSWFDYQQSILPGLKKGINTFWKDIQDVDYMFSFENILIDDISEVKGNILLGKFDQIVGFSDQEQLMNKENMEVYVLDEAGHNLPIDVKDELNKHFLRFIRSFTDDFV